MEVVDTHVHVFVPGLPLAPVRRYAPDYAATADDYAACMNAHGITRGVLVQPSFLGTDNGFLCEVLRAHPDRFRGIAVVAPGVPQAELDLLQASGVVGIRLNLEGLPVPDFAGDGWPALLAELRRRRWQVEVHRNARDLPALLPPLLDAGLDVVVDHFGHPDATLGIADPGFRYLLAQARSGHVWVKLSAGYRNGWTTEAAADGGTAAAAELLAHFGPQRLVWGTDWPHTRHESTASPARALRDLARWVPDAEARATIAGPTALRLYRF